ncbi:S-adenosyl-L-methionine-dependent methyltransferase [Phytophthora cactorum]|nr:S-adenosyl-L-methionine-dependent methyltransferase [Phytophthora cactorum]
MAMPSAEVNAASVTTIPNSMWKSQPLIQEGSLVILFETHNSLTYCYAQRDAIYQNRHGAFYHNDMIGQPFGSKIISRKKNARGYLILLAPTPELWSRALRHRTQIVFTLDASAIMFAAALRSGSRVVSLARAAVRSLPASHAQWRLTATAEIARRSSSATDWRVITVDCRDACEKGFPVELEGSIDMVFLDLPSPWNAVGHAAKMLKQGGFFASYSPCIEQVQKTCGRCEAPTLSAMIRTIETRLVPYNSRRIDLPVPDFGFGIKVKTENGSAASTVNEQKEEDSTRQRRKRRRNARRMVAASAKHIVAKKDDEIRGHTAYLTFATNFLSEEAFAGSVTYLVSENKVLG